MLEISIQPVNAQIVQQALQHIPGAITKAAKQAIHKSLMAGKKQARDSAKSRYTLPGSLVTKSLSVKSAGLSGVLKSKGSVNPAERAKVKSTGHGVHILAVYGQGGTLARSFFNPRTRKVTQRQGSSAYPIKRISTVSTPGMVMHPAVSTPTINKIGEILNREILAAAGSLI